MLQKITELCKSGLSLMMIVVMMMMAVVIMMVVFMMVLQDKCDAEAIEIFLKIMTMIGDD